MGEILSAEEVARDLLTVRIEHPHGVPISREWVEQLVASHEALRRERDEWRTEAQHWSSRPQEEAARARAAEAEVTRLREALGISLGMLDGFGEHVAASWAPHADYLYRQAMENLHSALWAAPKEGTDE